MLLSFWGTSGCATSIFLLYHVRQFQWKLIAGALVMSFNVWRSLKLSPRLQGHALMTRHSGSANPCPVIDFDAGFNAWMAYAYGLPKGTTVADKFGKPFGKFPPTPHHVVWSSWHHALDYAACYCRSVCVLRPLFLLACVLIVCFGCRPLFE